MTSSRDNLCLSACGRGFTLVELAVVMAIFGIIAAVSIPSYLSWRPAYRLRQAANDLLSDFQLAKVTAIKRNEQCSISLDQDVDGETFDYVAYIDADRDFQFDAGEEVVARNRIASYGYVGRAGNDFVDSNGHPTIAFGSDGIPVDKSALPCGGFFSLTNTAGDSSHLQISIAGSIWLE